MSAQLNPIRNGNFTSSEIYRLMGKPKPAETYITEKIYERELGRSLTGNITSRPTSWGLLTERRAFNVLPTDYTLNSDETIEHPTIKGLCGTPDGFRYIAEKTVVSIKSPYTLKSFCNLVRPLYQGKNGIEAMDWIRKNHDDGEKFYWQMVNDACISSCTHAELIVYCPYERELIDIRQLKEDAPDSLQSELKWLDYAGNDELPFLVNDGYYKNLNIIRFEVPVDDKMLLETTVTAALSLLPNAAIYQPTIIPQ